MIRKLFALAALAAAVTATSALAAQPYTGAELDTRESFMYGRFEARMYMAASSGLVSSMFLYYANEEHTQIVMIENGGDAWGTNTVSVNTYPISYYYNRGFIPRRCSGW